MTPGDDYWIMPWPSQHHGTVKWIKQISWTLKLLNPWKNRILVLKKSTASSSSTNQLWQKTKNMCQSDKSSCCKYSKTIIPTNRPNKVLYRQVCFHNGRPGPTILVGSWSQRRNTCRSCLGMKPCKGCQWVAIYIYICIYIYTYSLAMCQSHPIFLCFTSFGVQLVGRFGEGNLSRQKTLKPDWTSRFQKSSISPKNPKKTSLKIRLPYTTTSIPSPGICGCFFPSTWGAHLHGALWSHILIDLISISKQFLGGKHA